MGMFRRATLTATVTSTSSTMSAVLVSVAGEGESLSPMRVAMERMLLDTWRRPYQMVNGRRYQTAAEALLSTTWAVRLGW